MANNMLLAQPATAYIQGEQAGYQKDISQEQAGMAREQFKQQQQTGLLNQQISMEKLKQVQEKGGFEASRQRARKDASLLNAVLQLPPSQQQAGFQAVIPRLEKETTEMFLGSTGVPQFDPRRATLLRNTAIEFDKALPSTYGQAFDIQMPDGTIVPAQVDKSGNLKIHEGVKAPPKKGITMTTAGGDVISIGGDVPLQKPIARAQQQKAIDMETTLSNLGVIREKVNPKFFTYQGEFEQWASGKAAKAGIEVPEEYKEFASARRSFRNEVEQEFNAYRKEITGAAAAIQELKVLRDSFINMDLPEHEFMAALDQYEQKTKRSLRLARRLLREGLNVGTKEFGKRHDQLWLSGQDDDIDTRGDELESEGLPEEQVIEKLQEEGYF